MNGPAWRSETWAMRRPSNAFGSIGWVRVTRRTIGSSVASSQPERANRLPPTNAIVPFFNMLLRVK